MYLMLAYRIASTMTQFQYTWLQKNWLHLWKKISQSLTELNIFLIEHINSTRTKKIISLSHHLIDFGVAGERHFYATGHGKGACDGVGGTLKRIARRSCLQSGIKNEILTAQKTLWVGSRKFEKLERLFVFKGRLRKCRWVLEN